MTSPNTKSTSAQLWDIYNFKIIARYCKHHIVITAYVYLFADALSKLIYQCRKKFYDKSIEANTFGMTLADIFQLPFINQLAANR